MITIGLLRDHPESIPRLAQIRLIESTKEKAKEIGYPKLYLFAFDPTVPDYYTRLGWTHIGMDEFKGHPVTVMELEL